MFIAYITVILRSHTRARACVSMHTHTLYLFTDSKSKIIAIEKIWSGFFRGAINKKLLRTTKIRMNRK